MVEIRAFAHEASEAERAEGSERVDERIKEVGEKEEFEGERVEFEGERGKFEAHVKQSPLSIPPSFTLNSRTPKTPQH